MGTERERGGLRVPEAQNPNGTALTDPILTHKLIYT